MTREIRLTKEQKKVRAFYSGLGLLILGFYIIFLKHNNVGFIPSILGALLMLWRF